MSFALSAAVDSLVAFDGAGMGHGPTRELILSTPWAGLDARRRGGHGPTCESNEKLGSDAEVTG